MYFNQIKDKQRETEGGWRGGGGKSSTHRAANIYNIKMCCLLLRYIYYNSAHVITRDITK